MDVQQVFTGYDCLNQTLLRTKKKDVKLHQGYRLLDSRNV